MCSQTIVNNLLSECPKLFNLFKCVIWRMILYLRRGRIAVAL
jgi:hypothetical protein